MNIVEILKQRSIELAFLGVSVVALCVGLLINGRISEQLKYYEGFTYKEEEKVSEVKEMVVDLEGAVKNPGVYKVRIDARLEEAIRRAGGLSKDADLVYLQQHMNRAQSLSDQQKIYIPTVGDVKEMEKSGDGKGVLGAGATVGGSGGGSGNTASGININTAIADELDGLPGIGAVSVEKIVSGRPYASIDELKDKKIISASQFEAIKDLISAL